jgi:periplasmic protein TonB
VKRANAEMPRIVDVVFEGRRAPSLVRLLPASLVALAIHLVPWLFVAANIIPKERTHPIEKVKEMTVELERPPPPIEKPTEKPPKETPSETPRHKVQAPKEPPPPAAAQAAKLAGAAEPDPDAPIDLSGETFVTGDAVAYAGGVTAPKGTSTEPVFDRNASANGVVGGKGTRKSPPAPNASAPVSLREDEWHCPWPSEAEDSAIDVETVILRVTVDARGRVESSELVRDPGHGFGAAALACASRTRFVPARNREGHAVRSESPPIRVRFTR